MAKHGFGKHYFNSWVAQHDAIERWLDHTEECERCASKGKIPKCDYGKILNKEMEDAIEKHKRLAEMNPPKIRRSDASGTFKR